MSFWSTKNGMNRRQFLQSGGAITIASLLGDLIPVWVNKALAETPERDLPNFVLLRTFGGMDVTLGLDPLVMPANATQEDVFIEYRPDEIIQVAGLKFGPSAAPLVPHAKEVLVVNGIMMRRDAGHDVLNQYAITGRGDGKAASIPAEIAMATKSGPFGVLFNSNVYMAGKSMILSSAYELATEASNETLTELIEEKVKNAIPHGTPLEEAEKAVLAAREKAREFTKLLLEMKAKVPKLEERHILVAAFATGACSQAQLDFSPKEGFFDTHAQHEGTHLRAQKSFWSQVAEFIQLLKDTPCNGKSLFDNTLVMAANEFSRTPAMNAAKGKDHNPHTNSILLAGAGINGGSTVGSSQIIPKAKSKTGVAEHYAVPFDYATGKPATSPAGASFFYPENLIRTIAKIYQDPTGFKAVSYDLPVIPGIVK